MSTPRVRSFADLKSTLDARAQSVKVASIKSSADNDPVKEKDPDEKGNVSIPKDPDAAPAKQNTPESKTNADDQTKTLSPPAPAKTISGEEKPASLAAKAAAITGGLRKLADDMKLAPAAAGGKAVMPKMPAETPKNEGTDGGKLKPPSGGAGPKNNPDPAVKDAGAANGKPDTNGEPELDPTFLLKLAHAMLQTEEGRQDAQKHMERQYGAEAAKDIIMTAMFLEKKAEELESLQLEGARAAEEMWNNASPEEQASILKLAHIHELNKTQFKTDMEKLAYDAGAASAAEMADQGQLGQEAPGGIDEAILAALDEMVQSGELTPELAAQILQALQGAGGDQAGAGPGGPGGPGGGEGDMAAMMGGGGGGGGGEESEEEKQASAQVISVMEAARKLVIPEKAAA